MKRKEISERIRLGNLRRQEQQRDLQQLREEYKDERKELLSRKEAEKDPIRYLPSIIIALLFVSLPLSERVVDWILVGVFVVLNVVWAILFSSNVSWMNTTLLVVLNLFIVRWSPYMYDFPEMLARQPLAHVATFVGANILGGMLAYVFYISRSQGTSYRTTKDKHLLKLTQDEQTLLDDFARRKEKSWRIDNVCCVFLILNFTALLAAGVIPMDVLILGLRNLLRLLK